MKIKNKFLRYTLFGIILAVYFWIEYQAADSPDRPSIGSQPIVYTQHALCRINCRDLSKHEVQQVIETGSINYRKSEVEARPCPKYAYESSSPKRLRVVVGACPTQRKVITAIDLDRKFNCECR